MCSFAAALSRPPSDRHAAWTGEFLKRKMLVCIDVVDRATHQLPSGDRCDKSYERAVHMQVNPQPHTFLRECFGTTFYQRRLSNFKRLRPGSEIAFRKLINGTGGKNESMRGSAGKVRASKSLLGKAIGPRLGERISRARD